MKATAVAVGVSQAARTADVRASKPDRRCVMRAHVSGRSGNRLLDLAAILFAVSVWLLPNITLASNLLYDVTFGSPHTVGQLPTLGADEAPRLTPTSIRFGDPTVVWEMGALTDRPCSFGNDTDGYDQLEFAVGARWGAGFPYVYDAYHVEMNVLVENLQDPYWSGLTIHLDTPEVNCVIFRRHEYTSYGRIYVHPGGGEVGTYTLGVPMLLEIDLDIANNEWSVSVDGNWLHTGEAWATCLNSVRVNLKGASAGDRAALDNVRIEGIGESRPLLAPWVPAWQPLDEYAYVGDPVTFRVEPVGAVPIEYQWYENGNPIAGATRSSYTIPVTSAVDDGRQFYVQVSNGYGSTRSRTATLSVGATRCGADDPTADYETLHEITHLAEEGEVIAVEDGVYTGYDNWDINFQGKSVVLFSRSGNPQDCIIHCQEAGPPISHRGFVFASAESTVIRGMTIRYAGDFSGGAVFCHGAFPAFIDCIFTLSWGEYGGAVFIEERGCPSFTECKFEHCLTTRWGAAVFCVSGSPMFQGCRFSGSWAEHPSLGGVVRADGGVVNLMHCTFAGNDTAGACVSLGDGAVASLDHCIIASNVGQAVSCSESASAYMNCCNVYGNDGGDWVGCIAGQEMLTGNMAADPLFCDVAGHDYHLREDSPCAAENNPCCGQVGVLPVGCYLAEGYTLEQDLTGVWQSDAQWGDFDGDGDMDLVISGESDGGFVTRTYENQNGTLGWVPQADLPGVTNESSGNLAWGDYDGDGDLDLAIAGRMADETTLARIYENDAAGNLTYDTTGVLTGVASAALAWGDYDNDGDLDLVVTGHDATQPTSILYRNDPQGLLAPDSTHSLVGVAAGSADWGDYDGDGDVDLIITGNDGTQCRAIYYRNHPPGTLTADGDHGLIGVALSDVAAGDYDNDGDLDVALTGNTGTARIARIYRNDGSGSFMNAQDISDIYRSSCAWGDYDNDGDLDVAFCGYDGSNLETKMYENTGSGFSPTSFSFPSVREGCLSWADVDCDGDLDFLITGADWVNKYARLYDKIGGPSNTPPTAPTNLRFNENSGLELAWDAAFDDETPAARLYYCLRVGTTPGGNDVVSGTYASPLMGNVGQSTGLTLNIPVGIYYWSVKAIDSGLMASGWAPEQVIVMASVDGDTDRGYGIPCFALEPNVPNPFHRQTTITYSIPRQGHVRLAVYDVRGRLVRSLVGCRQEPGRHASQWNGTDKSDRNVASGVYFYRLAHDGSVKTRRMILLK
jgi:hypothetical protein